MAAATSDIIKGSNGIVAEFANSDLLNVTMNAKVIWKNGWRLEDGHGVWYEKQKPRITPGNLVKKDLYKLTAKVTRVVHTHTDATVTYLYSLEKDIFSCQVRVEHLGNSPLPFRTPIFKGPVIPVSPKLNTNMTLWHWTYWRHMTPRLMHPSWAVPIGAFLIGDETFGINFHTERHFDKHKLFLIEYRDPNAYRAEEPIEFHTDDEVASGDVRCFDMQAKISASSDWKVAMSEYRTFFQMAVGGIQYTPDDRPVGQFSSVDPTWIRPDNPYGFNDGNGSDVFRRFDKPECVKSWNDRVVAPLVEMGGSGCIHWGMQGWNHRGSMYRPEFDIFPPEIEVNLPALIKGFKDKGRRFGLAARPGEEAFRVNWTSDGTYRLHAGSVDQMNHITERFTKMKNAGVDLYYLDTFGNVLEDVEIMKVIRGVLGPDVPTFSEYCSDLMLPYSGRYTEWLGNGSYAFADERTLEMYRYLMPGTGVLMQRRAPLDYDTMGAKKFTPLIQDYELSWVKNDVAPFVQKYLKGNVWK